MPPKMCRCTICGRLITHRKSLSLEVLGGGEGRACRHHQQVADLVKAMEELKKAQHQRQEEQRVKNEVARKMRILGAASTLRVLHTTSGLPQEIFYTRLRMAGYPHDMIEEIKAEVERQGGPQMSPDELFQAVLGAADLAQRGLV